MKTLARIERIPLGQLVAATLSVMNVESSGYLIGEEYKSKTLRFFDVHALHLEQLTERKPASIVWDTNEMKKAERFLDIIGGFHSHIYRRTIQNGNHIYENGLFKLSETDIEGIREYYLQGIELLAVMNPVKAYKEITIARNYISGGIQHQGRTYFMKMGIFYLEKGKCKKADIIVNEDDVASVFGS